MDESAKLVATENSSKKSFEYPFARQSRIDFCQDQADSFHLSPTTAGQPPIDSITSLIGWSPRFSIKSESIGKPDFYMILEVCGYNYFQSP